MNVIKKILFIFQTLKVHFFILKIKVNLCGKVFTINSSKFLMCDWSKCYLLITPIEIPVIILGDLFMREYYTHFI